MVSQRRGSATSMPLSVCVSIGFDFGAGFDAGLMVGVVVGLEIGTGTGLVVGSKDDVGFEGRNDGFSQMPFRMYPPRLARRKTRGTNMYAKIWGHGS